MKWTLKELLKQCRLGLKKTTSKRDKWVKEWPGQVIVNTKPLLIFTTPEQLSQRQARYRVLVLL